MNRATAALLMIFLQFCFCDGEDTQTISNENVFVEFTQGSFLCKIEQVLFHIIVEDLSYCDTLTITNAKDVILSSGIVLDSLHIHFSREYHHIVNGIGIHFVDGGGGGENQIPFKLFTKNYSPSSRSASGVFLSELESREIIWTSVDTIMKRSSDMGFSLILVDNEDSLDKIDGGYYSSIKLIGGGGGGENTYKVESFPKELGNSLTNCTTKLDYDYGSKKNLKCFGEGDCIVSGLVITGDQCDLFVDGTFSELFNNNHHRRTVYFYDNVWICSETIIKANINMVFSGNIFVSDRVNIAIDSPESGASIHMTSNSFSKKTIEEESIIHIETYGGGGGDIHFNAHTTKFKVYIVSHEGSCSVSDNSWMEYMFVNCKKSESSTVSSNTDIHRLDLMHLPKFFENNAIMDGVKVLKSTEIPTNALYNNPHILVFYVSATPPQVLNNDQKKYSTDSTTTTHNPYSTIFERCTLNYNTEWNLERVMHQCCDNGKIYTTERTISVNGEGGLEGESKYFLFDPPSEYATVHFPGNIHIKGLNVVQWSVGTVKTSHDLFNLIITGVDIILGENTMISTNGFVSTDEFYTKDPHRKNDVMGTRSSGGAVPGTWFSGWKSVTILDSSVIVKTGNILDNVRDNVLFVNTDIQDLRILEVEESYLIDASDCSHFEITDSNVQMNHHCAFLKSSLHRKQTPDTITLKSTTILNCGRNTLYFPNSCVCISGNVAIHLENNLFRDESEPSQQPSSVLHPNWVFDIKNVPGGGGIVRFKIKNNHIESFANGYFLDGIDPDAISFSALSESNLHGVVYQWRGETKNHSLVSEFSRIDKDNENQFVYLGDGGGTSMMYFGGGGNLGHLTEICYSSQNTSNGDDSPLCPTDPPSECIVDSFQYDSTPKHSYHDSWLFRRTREALKNCKVDSLIYQGEPENQEEYWHVWSIGEESIIKTITGGSFITSSSHPHILGDFESLVFINCTFTVQNGKSGMRTSLFKKDHMDTGDISFIDCTFVSEFNPINLFQDVSHSLGDDISYSELSIVRCSFEMVTADYIGFQSVVVIDSSFRDSHISIRGSQKNFITGNTFTKTFSWLSEDPVRMFSVIDPRPQKRGFQLELSDNIFIIEGKGVKGVDSTVNDICVYISLNEMMIEEGGESMGPNVDDYGISFGGNIFKYDLTQGDHMSGFHFQYQERNIAVQVKGSKTWKKNGLGGLLVKDSLFQPQQDWIYVTEMGPEELFIAQFDPNSYSGIICDVLFDCTDDLISDAIVGLIIGLFAICVCCVACCVIIEPKRNHWGKTKKC